MLLNIYFCEISGEKCLNRCLSQILSNHPLIISRYIQEHFGLCYKRC